MDGSMVSTRVYGISLRKRWIYDGAYVACLLTVVYECITYSVERV